MARKRKNASSNPTSSSKHPKHPTHKRPRTSLDKDEGSDENGSSIKFPQAGGYIDATTGQRGAFPGLDTFAGGDDDFYGPPSDGLEYLRMVRSEARGVPELLLAPHVSSSHRPPAAKPQREAEDVVLNYDEPTAASGEGEGEGGEHCYFAESTYVSLHPSPARSAAPAFHAPILRLFVSLRGRLSSTPPRGAASRPFPRWSDAKAWRALVSTQPPRLGWVWSMQQWEVVRLLGDVAGWIGWRMRVRNARGRGMPKNWGAWCWALLLRCQDVMVAEEVAVVRELGKVAVGMRRGMMVGEREGEGEGDEGKEAKEAEEGDGAETEETKVEVSSKAEEAKESEQEVEEGVEEEGEVVEPKKPEIEFYSVEDSIGMLDMIISVVGDFFGQRDLLEERAAMGSR
ncbi:hypothetical protein BZA05DRAFT_377799 [Tricharina praecox]|uniref:uncharacterized protein n=1 Tax=Tricharina praecox TaxID=43433 RepID=UPI0022211333|nr:uncharacterized protein BZA05DRAFT_377799 [Tricharina praecox]KAI5845925.1 hypothetical protein BZA05DRAFT_377799 [Tricharina praecox]